ncbi:MAG: hypothetical protein QOD69_1240 [Solirubrobacteraceae bacterium]|nr:hypothetical protein [Solirubrobacteraceae bacterium]
MKGLLSTRASRAWLVVALVGLAVVVLVLALRLGSRLGAGQDLVDAAEPAFTDARVAGDRAGIDFISRYVDLADPLMTRRGGAGGELPALLRVITRRSKLSQAEAAAALRREAPHTEALLRALPLAGVAGEIPRFTRYLATKLNTSEEGLAAQFEQSYPRLAQTLTALPSVTSGWNDIPGMDGATRFDGTTPIKTVPELRDYLGKDLVAAVERNKEDVQDVAAHGGIGSIPRLLLVLGAVVLLFGLLQIRRARDAPPGKPSWGVVVALGVLVVALVGTQQYFPRLDGADRALAGLDPAFAEARVAGDRAGIDMLHQAVLFGDPIATQRGGAAAEVPQLLTFVAQQTGTRRATVLAGLRRRAPRTTALLQAIPLSAVAGEVPHLLTFLGRRLKLSRAQLVATLQLRTPRLAQSLLTVRPVAIRWNSVPGTAGLTRLDGTPVRTMPAVEAYFDKDVVPILETQRANFRELADPWPPLTVLPPLLLGVGALLVLYGALMLRVATKRR